MEPALKMQFEAVQEDPSVSTHLLEIQPNDFVRYRPLPHLGCSSHSSQYTDFGLA